MGNPSRLSSRFWLLAPACALGLILWSDADRASRVSAVSDYSHVRAFIDPGSPTGYSDAKRWLIVPEHDNPTYQWISETQLMLRRGGWRVRSVDYENAPYGRPVYSATPYRAWFVAVAWCVHAMTGMPMAACVERAALYADPVLHVVVLLLATILVAWRFGLFCAALVSVGLAALFPLAGSFLPGIANDFGLELCATLAAILLVVAGATASRNASRWYFAAGLAGGVGLWISAMGQMPVVAGLALGGFTAATVNLTREGWSRGPASPASPWRTWALGGALTCLAAYLIEFFPGHMDFELRVNSPLYGLAWLGLGDLLDRYSAWTSGPSSPRNSSRGWILAGLSAAAIASVPVALWATHGLGFLEDDLLSSRLTQLPGSAVAGSLFAWILRDGFDAAFAAAFLPLILLTPAVWLLFSKRTTATHRAGISVALGPVVVALAFSAARIRWWNTLDVALLGVLAATAASISALSEPRQGRWAVSVIMSAVLAIGLTQVVPKAAGGKREIKLTRTEAEGLYERTLAHWIADHAGPEGVTILAPPYRTSSLCFYGGLRGLGTQNWENGDGLDATFHIVTAMNQSEARAVITQRGVTHVVLPAWDSDLYDFARLRLKNPDDSFVSVLHKTEGSIFGWLRPVPFELPPVAGFEDRSVLILEVTDDTDPATVRGRRVEYLLEMHRLDDAANEAQALALYPTDLGSRVAMAQLAAARGDKEGFGNAFGSIIAGLSRGSDRSIAMDRRVSLAVVLAIGGRTDLSRAQARRCLLEIDGPRLRFLSEESLYHLLLLGQRYGIALGDPGLRALSLKLLPENLRTQF